MRGWPIGEVIGLGISLALLLWPLYESTVGRRLPATSAYTATSPDPLPPPETSVIQASVRFAHLPRQFTVRIGDAALWTLTPVTSSSVSKPLTLPWADQTVELFVDVEWPKGTPETVVELTLEPDHLEGLTRTVWGRESLSIPLHFTWPLP